MPNLRFSVEAEDRGSAEVDKLSRNVGELDRDIDGLSRSLDREAQAATRAERDTSGLASGMGSLTTAVGGTLAGVGALAAGFVALTRQQAAYHRLVLDSAFVSNRSQRDVEALIRTLQQYGIEIDSTEDALRTFYDRLGDARADPNIEAAQIFQQIGLEIDRADVRLEDFLERIQTLDRQSQIFVVETVLGGEGSRILRAAADAGFRGSLEANLTMTLDPEDRRAILQADQQIERATQALSTSVDRLLAGNSGIITAAVTTLDRIISNLPQFLRGDAFGIAIGATTGGGARPQPFIEQGPPAPDTGQRLRLDVPQQAPAGFSNVIGEPTISTARRLTLAERGGALGIRGDQAIGPDLRFAEGLAAVPGLRPDLETPFGAEAQVILGGMADELAAIHFELAEFLPEIANNTLSSVSAAADFAAQPNFLTLLRLGTSTVRLLGGILRQSEPDPFLPEGTDVSAFRAAPFGRVDPTAAASPFEDVVPEPPAELPIEELGIYAHDLEGILNLIDPELVARFRELQSQARTVWDNITAATDDSQVRYQLFSVFMEDHFRPQWDEFQTDALAAWDANREGLGLNEQQIQALDAYLRGPFISTIDAFEQSFIGSWEAIASSEAGFEEQTRQIAALVGEEMPLHAALLEAGLTGVWQSALASVDEFGLAASKVNAQLGEETLEIQGGVNSVEEAFALLAAGIISVGEFVQVMEQLNASASTSMTGEITTVEEAYAALAAGIITTGEFAEITAALAVESAGNMGDAADGAAGSYGRVRFQLQGIRADLLAIPEQKTITITTIERRVVEEEVVSSIPSRFSGDPFAGDPFRRGERLLFPEDPFEDDPFGRQNPFANDPFNRPGRGGFQDGGRFLVDRPSYFLAGEAGREVVQITPENAQQAPGRDGGNTLVFNYYGRPGGDREFEDMVVRAVQDSSRRGADLVDSRGVFAEGDR